MRVYSFSKNYDMELYRKFFSDALGGASYDLLSSHSLKSFLVLGLSLFRSRPLIVIVHDQRPHPNFKFPIIFILNVAIALLANKIILFSAPNKLFRHVAHKVIQLPLPAVNDLEKIYNVNAISENCHNLEELKLTSFNRPFALILGRYDRYKASQQFVSNFRSLQTNLLSDIGWDIIVAGRDWSKSPLKSHNRVYDCYFTGEEVEYLISKCSLFLLPYESATQSGFIPMLSRQKKKVIATDLIELRRQAGRYCDIAFTSDWSFDSVRSAINDDPLFDQESDVYPFPDEISEKLTQELSIE